jgi:fructose-specific component phosphotransferase system IIB-like protein
MSIYTLLGEPAIAAPAETTIFAAAGGNGVAGTVTGAVMRQFANNGLVAVTASTLALTAAAHAGRLVTIDRAAGMVITLPVSAGTGDVYELFIMSTTAGTTTIKVPAASVAIMKGFAILGQDSGNATEFYATAADTDTITLYVSGSTTGGIAGARVTLRDVATAVWAVEYFSDAAGSEATPFSATV